LIMLPPHNSPNFPWPAAVKPLNIIKRLDAAD
jgi:hypothetical protein